MITTEHRPVFPHVRIVHYHGAQWRVSTRLVPRVVVQAWQGTTGRAPGYKRYSYWRGEMFQPLGAYQWIR